MRLSVLVITLSFLAGAAHASTVSVSNGDFEAPYELTNVSVLGNWEFGAPGWTAGGAGAAGTWEFADSVFGPGIPAAIGDRVAYANAGSTLSQSLGINIEANTDYSLSAIFGNRMDVSAYEGSYGFYVGDPANIIGSLYEIVNPGDGVFSVQSMTALSSLFVDYIGQELGIIFTAKLGQINFDNVGVEMFQYQDEYDVVPVPAAIWLFGSALFAGGFFTRRKKAV
jgi:hapalindole biogenesis HpiC1 cyclase-like protein